MKKSRNAFGKGKLMLSQVVLLAALFSCKKEDIQPPVSQDLDTSNIASQTFAASSPNHLVYQESFEGSVPFVDYVYKQVGTSYGLTSATSPVAAGSRSARFELRDSDPLTSGGTRSEVLFPEQSKLNRWYAFSVYFPSADYAKDSYTEIINQWHQGGGVSPAVALEVQNDHYNVVFASGASGTGSTQRMDVGAIKKDSWNRIVFHINHANSSAGLVEMWVNGVKVLNRAGSNMYSLSSYGSPRWKMGIYKWKWNDTKTTDTKKRVLYFDDVRIGNETATYSDLAAGTTSTSTSTATTSSTSTTTSTTTAPTTTTSTSTSTQSVASFTLVNASLDKDVMTIANGATISMGALGITKFNIRANMSPSTVGSVKFELSGAQSRTYVDNQFPYSVQGDDGAGNYYFGNWSGSTAYGTYTLKVTPYTKSSAGGTAGASKTISFTVTK